MVTVVYCSLLVVATLSRAHAQQSDSAEVDVEDVEDDKWSATKPIVSTSRLDSTEAAKKRFAELDLDGNGEITEGELEESDEKFTEDRVWSTTKWRGVLCARV